MFLRCAPFFRAGHSLFPRSAMVIHKKNEFGHVSRVGPGLGPNIQIPGLNRKKEGTASRPKRCSLFVQKFLISLGLKFAVVWVTSKYRGTCACASALPMTTVVMGAYRATTRASSSLSCQIYVAVELYDVRITGYNML